MEHAREAFGPLCAERVFFIGGRGSGKTTAGRALAERLGWDFADTDLLVEKEAHVSIADMVAEHGWEHFREKECQALKKVCQKDRIVVATGGGIILRPENRSVLRQAGHVVWLKTEAPVLVARIETGGGWGSRPSLTGASPAQEMENILLQRAPLYAETATQVVDGALDVEEVVEQVRGRLKR